jgi:hypothetical protein
MTSASKQNRHPANNNRFPPVYFNTINLPPSTFLHARNYSPPRTDNPLRLSGLERTTPSDPGQPQGIVRTRRGNLRSYQCEAPGNLHPISTPPTHKFHQRYDILQYRNVVASSSAWAGLKEEATVDEVEAVRIISGEPPGFHHTPKKSITKPDRQRSEQTVPSDVGVLYPF